MNPYPRYSNDELLTIRQDAGVISAKEIAYKIKKPEQGVHKQANKMGVSLRLIGEDHYRAKLSNVQVKMIDALVEWGFSITDIHRELFNDLSYSCIYQSASKYNRKER